MFFYFKSKWLIIVVFGVVEALLWFRNTHNIKSVYVATLSFTLEDEKGSGGLTGLASHFGFDVGGAGGVFSVNNNLIILMKSHSLIEKILLKSFVVNGSRVSLSDHYIDFNEWREQWTLAEKSLFRFPINTDRKQFNIQKDSIPGLVYKEMIDATLFVA